jgi:16S rRNA (uracil1498-N3)-methyltransferase
MQHFFITPEQVQDGYVEIVGEDVNHMLNVLRMKPGEAFMANDGCGKEYYCILEQPREGAVLAKIAYERAGEQELPCPITLYQGLPKGDKLELIIQKCVELGVTRIVPVRMKRSVMKLDDKKAAGKRTRWQAISEAAAKQSGRGMIPKVALPMSFKEAMEEAAGADVKLFPYELAGTESPMAVTRAKLSAIEPGQSIAVFIGPEGGFDDGEVALAIATGYEPITLGKRILRTETAGLYVLSVLGYLLEK